MPPVVIFAASVLGGVVGALGAIGTAVTFGLAGYGTLSTVVGLATVLGATAAIKGLVPEIPQMDSDQARQSTVKGTVEPQKLIYGEALVSGPIFFVGLAGTENRELYHSIALTGHEVEDIIEIHFDNEVITDNLIDSQGRVTSGTFAPIDGDYICNINRLYGTATQGADSLLQSAFPSKWTTAHKSPGISCITTQWVLTDGSQELWDRLKPQNIKARVKGKKDIYDPRLDTAAGANPSSATYQQYTTNPALCVANYLTDTKFGLSVPVSKIDWEAVEVAANACDVLVDIPNSQTQKRFTANGVLYGSDSHKANIDKLLSSMNGTLIYSNGVYKINAGIYQAPTENLTEDDLASSISVKTSVERGERFNTIRPIFADPTQNYKNVEAPEVQLTSAVSRDNNEVLIRDVDLPFTNNSFMAQRLAHKQIQLSDQQKVITFPCNLSGLRIDVGDRVTVTVSDLNYSNKVFRCAAWSFSDTQDGVVNLTLLEDDAGSYADPSVGEYSTRSPAGVISAGFRGVPDPQNLSATAGLKNIELNWTNPVNTSKFKEIVIYASPDSAWTNAVEIGRTLGTQFFHDASNGADPIAVGDERYYWIRAVAYGTGTGSFVESDRNPDNDVSTISATVGPNNPDYSDIVDNTPAQAAPTALTLTETTALGNDGSVLPAVLVSWTAPTPNTYVSFYELEFKRTSVGEIDYGSIASAYTSTIDYGSVADGTTTELNYGSVSEDVVGGDAVFSNIAVYGTNTTIAGLVELQEYTFRVKAVTLTGKTSGTISNTLTLQGDNTPPSLPSTVTATGGIQQITLNWENPSDSDFAYVEIFENTTNNQAGSTLVVQTPSDNHTIAGLGNSVTRYYWLRCVDRSGNISSFTAGFNATTQKIGLDDFTQAVIDQFEAGDAFGIAPVNSIAALGTGDHVGQIKFLTTTSTLYVWTGSAWTTDLYTASNVDPGSITAASFAAGIEPISAVTTLPSPVGYTGPKTVFQTSDAKLYRYDSTVPEFTTLVKTTDLSGTLGDNLFSDTLRPVERVTTLPTTNLVTGRIVMLTTDSKIYRYNGTSWTSSIAAADLSDQLNLATQAAGLLPEANASSGLKNANVTMNADGTLSGAGSGQATLGGLGAGAVASLNTITETYIGSNAITAGKIASNAITANKILAGAVTAAKIDALAVTAEKISAGAITADKIGVNAVTADKITSGAISTDKLAANSVNADKIAANSVAASEIVAGSITSSELNTSQVFSDSAVVGQIQASAITTAAITAKVANVEFIQSNNIAANAITAGKLAASNVVTASAQISDGIITNAKIGSVIQSSNYSAGSAGWIINKNGSAEFNGVVVSRDLIVATGSQTLSDRSGLFNNDITTLETIYIEGVYPAGFTAWGGANSTLLCNVEITGSWFTNVGSESTAMIGPVATVMPLTKFSGTQGFTLKIEIVGRKVAGWGSPSDFGIAWKLYKVT